MGGGASSRTAIRNVRREANEAVKQLKKNGDVSEDEERQGLKQVQELTDVYVERIDELIKNKEREVLGQD